MEQTPQNLNSRRVAKELGGKLLGAQTYIEFFPIEETDTVLDVGCGKGTEVIAYYQHGTRWHNLVATDVDQGAIEEARRIARLAGVPHTTFSIANAEHLPFDDASFDKVLAIDLIQVVGDPQRVLHELCRVLKPGGQLLITFPAFWHFALTALSQLKARILCRAWDRGGSLSVMNWTLTRWLALSESLPFTLVRSRASTLFPPLHRYGIPRFWFSNKLIHRIDRFLSNLPLLRRFGQALICVYRKR